MLLSCLIGVDRKSTLSRSCRFSRRVFDFIRKQKFLPRTDREEEKIHSFPSFHKLNVNILERVKERFLLFSFCSLPLSKPARAFHFFPVLFLLLPFPAIVLLDSTGLVRIQISHFAPCPASLKRERRGRDRKRKKGEIAENGTGKKR